MSFSPFYNRLEEKGNKQSITEETMTQWINLLQNNSFVNGQQLPLLYEKTVAISLVLLDLMAGWQVYKQVLKKDNLMYFPI